MVKLFSKNSNLCDHNSQTDRQTTCDRNTALCTKVHRAVKTVEIGLIYTKQFKTKTVAFGAWCITTFLHNEECRKMYVRQLSYSLHLKLYHLRIGARF